MTAVALVGTLVVVPAGGIGAVELSTDHPALTWSLLVAAAADAIAPAGGDANFEEQLRNVRMELTLDRFSPQTLYEQASTALLAPDVRSLDVLLPEQVDRAVPGELSLPQSLLVVWTQITVLVALIVAIFVAAYVQFLHQEIRA